MSGSGLQQLMEVILSPNAVQQILLEKGLNRVTRANMLVDAILNAILSFFALNFSLSDEGPGSAQNPTNLTNTDCSLPRDVDGLALINPW